MRCERQGMVRGGGSVGKEEGGEPHANLSGGYVLSAMRTLGHWLGIRTTGGCIDSAVGAAGAAEACTCIAPISSAVCAAVRCETPPKAAVLRPPHQDGRRPEEGEGQLHDQKTRCGVMARGFMASHDPE